MTVSRIPSMLAFAGLVVIGAACSSGNGSVSSASSSVAASEGASASGSASVSAAASASGVQTSAFDLELGECFTTDDITTVTEVSVVDCDASHVYEVFGLTTYEGGATESFPGDDTLNTAADAACRPAFEDYVGVAYDDSRWFGTFINPSASTWADGDREIVCVLHTQEEEPVAGSARGTAE